MRINSTYPFCTSTWSQRAACVSLLIVLSSPCLAQKPTTLRRIEFVGLKKMTVPQAIEASGLKVGDPFNPEIGRASCRERVSSVV